MVWLLRCTILGRNSPRLTRLWYSIGTAAVGAEEEGNANVGCLACWAIGGFPTHLYVKMLNFIWVHSSLEVLMPRFKGRLCY